MAYTKAFELAGHAFARKADVKLDRKVHLVLKGFHNDAAGSRADVMDLCRISVDQAAKLLAKLKTDNKITQQGKNKGVIFVPGSNI